MQEGSFIPTIAVGKSSAMSPGYLFRLGQHLRGKAGAYRITKQLSVFVYFAVYVLIVTHLCSLPYLAITNSNQQGNPVVVKSVEGHWRLHNEHDILKRFQARTSTLRPLLDEVEDPAEPPAIVLKYLDDDITIASRKQRLTRQEIKYVAKNVLEALQVLHEDGYVHTGTRDFKHYSILLINTESQTLNLETS